MIARAKASVILVVALLVAAPVHGSGILTVPDGTVTGTGEGAYDYVLSDASFDAQNCGTVHVIGTVTFAEFSGVNSGWVEFGLINSFQKDRALVEYGVPSYMFNNSVFMLTMLGSGGPVAMPGDYAGDFAGGTGEEQSAAVAYTFDLKLEPNAGSTGGIAYLSINGGPFGAGLEYGTDNWNLYGWDFPDEDMSESFLIVQLYNWHTGTTTVMFENVQAYAEGGPSAVESTSWGQIKGLYR